MRTNLNEGEGVIQTKDNDTSENNSTAQEINYIYVLNKLLPDEIQVLAWTPVPLDFKARLEILLNQATLWYTMLLHRDFVREVNSVFRVGDGVRWDRREMG